MPWIASDRKIRAAAFLVRRIYRRIRTFVKMRAGRGDHVAAGRKTDDTKLVRVNVPFGGAEAHQSERPLRIFQRQR